MGACASIRRSVSDVDHLAFGILLSREEEKTISEAIAAEKERIERGESVYPLEQALKKEKELEEKELQNLLRKVALNETQVCNTLYWKRPVEFKVPTKIHFRHYASLKEFMKARNFRLKNNLTVEPRRFARGPPRFPDFFQPFVDNEDIRLYLRIATSVKDAIFRHHIEEYDYLLSNLTSLSVIVGRATGPNDISVRITENHRNRKQRGHVRQMRRTMHTTHAWVVHGDAPVVIFKGVDFRVCLYPKTDARGAAGGEGRVRGMYRRCLDTLAYSESIMPEWAIETVNLGSVC